MNKPKSSLSMKKIIKDMRYSLVNGEKKALAQ